MFNSSFHLGCRIYIVALLILTLSISSCKKTAPGPDPDEAKQQQAAVAKTQEQTDTDEQIAAKVVDTDAASNVQETDLVPIPIQLPKAKFEGTPKPTQVPNLEKPLGKARPPFYAPVGTVNVAFQKPVSASDEEPTMGEIEMITDGDKEALDGSYLELGPFLQYITIDLEQECEIYAILLWHFHKYAVVYFDVVVQISNEPDFITDVTTVFNNDIDHSAGQGVGTNMHYVETNEGKLIDCMGTRGRYVRLYSNGNTADDLNHYIEVEVFGRPAE
jgi:hypothetical protein